MIHIDKVKSELKLKPFGQKGWLSNSSLSCPDCGRSGKLGVKFNDDNGRIHCFYCNYSINLYTFLKLIERRDLYSFEREISINQTLQPLFPIQEEKEVKELTVKLPHKLQYITQDDYLDSRRFLPEHYKSFKPAFTESFLEKKLHDCIIFQIFQEGKLVSWLARSRKSYEWHKENLRKAKLNQEQLILRWQNSEGTEFDQILGGYDDITENTHTVILVEGLFDKVGTDNNLNLYQDEDIRCLFTFGNKISTSQIELLRKKKSVKRTILLYDYGTIKQSKTYSLNLSKYFEVLIGIIRVENLDPGDMVPEQAYEVFNDLQNPIEFYANNLNSVLV